MSTNTLTASHSTGSFIKLGPQNPGWPTSLAEIRCLVYCTLSAAVRTQLTKPWPEQIRETTWSPSCCIRAPHATSTVRWPVRPLPHVRPRSAQAYNHTNPLELNHTTKWVLLTVEHQVDLECGVLKSVACCPLMKSDKRGLVGRTN